MIKIAVLRGIAETESLTCISRTSCQPSSFKQIFASPQIFLSKFYTSCWHPEAQAVPVVAAFPSVCRHCAPRSWKAFALQSKDRLIINHVQNFNKTSSSLFLSEPSSPPFHHLPTGEIKALWHHSRRQRQQTADPVLAHWTVRGKAEVPSFGTWLLQSSLPTILSFSCGIHLGSFLFWVYFFSNHFNKDYTSFPFLALGLSNRRNMDDLLYSDGRSKLHMWIKDHRIFTD